MYTISEIIEFKSNDNGQLHCIFRLEEDEHKTARVLLDDNYYDWVQQSDSNRDYYIESSIDDDLDEFNLIFDFEAWKDDNETEEYVMDYIYNNYSLYDLPDPERIKK